MTPLRYFDSSCFVGLWGCGHPGAFRTSRELLTSMDHFGIERALVYHALARYGAAAIGNSLLEAEVRNNKRLEPIWVLLPEFFDDPYGVRWFEEEFQRRRFRAARIFPASCRHNFSVQDGLCRRLLEFLEQRRIPLFVDRDEISWEDWSRLLSSHPNLPVIMVNPGYRNERRLLTLFETKENLRVETSTFVGHRRLSAWVRRFGARRIIFGTQMPLWDPGAILAILAYAEIEPEEKVNIAYRNIEHLLDRIDA